MRTVERITHVSIIATALFCLAMICGCAPSSTESELKDSTQGVGSAANIEELPAQGEFAPSDPTSRGRFHVQIPEGYERSEYLEDIEPYTGKRLELETVTVDLGDKGSLRITVDDVGFFDWWYSDSVYGTASVAEYVESATATGHGSSWPMSIGGRDGIVFVDASAGGETSGQAFVFLDGATIAISAVLPDGVTATDAYSAFFRSREVAGLFGGLAITEQ